MGRGELWLLSVNFLRPLSSNKVKTMKIKQEFAPGSAPKALVALFLTLKKLFAEKIQPSSAARGQGVTQPGRSILLSCSTRAVPTNCLC